MLNRTNLPEDVSTTSWLISLWGTAWHQLLLATGLGCNLKVNECRLRPNTSRYSGLVKISPQSLPTNHSIYSRSIWLSLNVYRQSLYADPVQLPQLPLPPYVQPSVLSLPHNAYSSFPISLPAPYRLHSTGFLLLFLYSASQSRAQSSLGTGLVDCQFSLPGPVPSFPLFCLCHCMFKVFLIGSGLQIFICRNTQRATATRKPEARSISSLLVELVWRASGCRSGTA